MNWPLLVIAGGVLLVALGVVANEARQWGLRRTLDGMGALLVHGLSLTLYAVMAVAIFSAYIAIAAAVVIGIGYLLRLGWNAAL